MTAVPGQRMRTTAQRSPAARLHSSKAQRRVHPGMLRPGPVVSRPTYRPGWRPPRALPGRDG